MTVVLHSPWHVCGTLGFAPSFRGHSEKPLAWWSTADFGQSCRCFGAGVGVERVVSHDAAEGFGAPDWIVFGQSERRLKTVVIFVFVHGAVGFREIAWLPFRGMRSGEMKPTLHTCLHRRNEASTRLQAGVSPR